MVMNHGGSNVKEHLETDLADDLAHFTEVRAFRKIGSCQKVLYQSCANVVSPADEPKVS